MVSRNSIIIINQCSDWRHLVVLQPQNAGMRRWNFLIGFRLDAGRVLDGAGHNVSPAGVAPRLSLLLLASRFYTFPGRIWDSCRHRGWFSNSFLHPGGSTPFCPARLWTGLARVKADTRPALEGVIPDQGTRINSKMSLIMSKESLRKINRIYKAAMLSGAAALAVGALLYNHGHLFTAMLVAAYALTSKFVEKDGGIRYE